MDREIKIALAGEGGQGVQLIAELLAEAANDEGKEALYIPNFGVEQRGGVSVAFVQIADKQIGSPKFQKADIIIALSDRAVNRTLQYVNDSTVFVYDDSLASAPEASKLPSGTKVYGIAANEVAKTELHPRVFNILILGAVNKLADIFTLDQIKKGLDKKIGDKFELNPRLRDLNYQALEEGEKLVEQVVGKGGRA